MPLLASVDDAAEDGLGSGGPAGGEDRAAAMDASTLRGLASVDAAAAAVQQASDRLTAQFVRRPYVVSMTSITGSLTGAAGLQGTVHDIAFLFCYFQPTIAVLQVRLRLGVKI
jgi:hypothetical protein